MTDDKYLKIGSEMHATIEELRMLEKSGKEIPKILVTGDVAMVEAVKAELVANQLETIASAITYVPDTADACRAIEFPMPPPFTSPSAVYEYVNSRVSATGRHYHDKPNIKEIDPMYEMKAAVVREDNRQRKELNFRKRLPKNHPDRIN